MALLIDSRDLAGLISLDDAINAVRKGFTDQGNCPSFSAPKTRIQHEDRRITVHPGGCPSLEVSGMFIHAERFTFKGDAQQYNGAGRRVYVAYNSETAELRGVIVGSLPLYSFDNFEECFGTETSITSAVGTDLFARKDSKVLGLLGTGLQARRHLIAMAKIRPIEEVRVYSRSLENRNKFIEVMNGHCDLEMRAVEEAEQAVYGADLICCATNTNVPALYGEWLSGGQHVTSIVNSTKGVMQQAKLSKPRREIDDEVVRRADKIMVNIREQSIVEEHGDLCEPIEHGFARWEDIVEIGEVLTEKTEGRTSNEQITLFKQNSDQGVGFMGIAKLACDIAEANNIGIEI